MPCAVFRAYCAPGGPEQNQRRQRLAHPERPLCPISVQRQADWEIAFSAAQHSDAAGTRPARPRTAIYAEGGKNVRSVLSLPSGKLIRKLYFLATNVPTPRERAPRGRAQQPMQKERTIRGLSYPKRIRQRFVFWVSQAIAAAARTRQYSLQSTRNDRTASISAAAGVISRWTYIILCRSGLCGKGAPGGAGRGGRAAGREHCMGPPASKGATCRLCRNTAAPPLLKKTNFAPRPPSKVKLSFFAGRSRSVPWMLSNFVKPKLNHRGHN